MTILGANLIILVIVMVIAVPVIIGILDTIDHMHS